MPADKEVTVAPETEQIPGVRTTAFEVITLEVGSITVLAVVMVFTFIKAFVNLIMAF